MTSILNVYLPSLSVSLSLHTHTHTHTHRVYKIGITLNILFCSLLLSLNNTS